MATFTIQGSDSVLGSARSDIFVIDPDNLGAAHITDCGGSADVLLVYDRPGRTAGEFLVDVGDLVWRNYQGDEVRIALNKDGSSPVEFFRWQRLAEDGAPYTQTNKIILPGTAVTETNVTLVGTALNDTMAAARFGSYVGGFTEIYGNDGNDRLTGSDTTRTLIYGGNGRDLETGIGAVADDFSGDGGADTLRGVGGNDLLDGGAGGDLIFGGLGNDTVIGGAGSDRLSGGLGRDTVQFNPKEIGIDHIVDYEIGKDTLLFAGIAASKVHFEQIGVDVVITLGSAASVVVEHALIADLTLVFA